MSISRGFRGGTAGLFVVDLRVDLFRVRVEIASEGPLRQVKCGRGMWGSMSSVVLSERE